MDNSDESEKSTAGSRCKDSLKSLDFSEGFASHTLRNHQFHTAPSCIALPNVLLNGTEFAPVFDCNSSKGRVARLLNAGH